MLLINILQNDLAIDDLKDKLLDVEYLFEHFPKNDPITLLNKKNLKN